MSHASLVAKERRKVDGLAFVIHGEGLHLTPVTFAPLLGQKPKGSMAWRREFTMGLKRKIVKHCQ